MKAKSSTSLLEEWALLKEADPKLRIRQAAQQLGVSEAQLLATGCGSDGVIRLTANWGDFLEKEIPTLGVARAITRNEHVVHERVGVYENPSFKANAHVGLFVGEDIDLRVFLHHWHVAFSVTERTHKDLRRSLQFFNPQGMALHKIYLTPQSDVGAFTRIAETHRSADQSTQQPVVTTLAGHDTSDDIKPLDVVAFQEAWRRLKDTHDFYPLLRRFGLSRLDALTHAPRDFSGVPSKRYALRLNNESFRAALTEAATAGILIMVFVSNPGMLQIHTGQVKKLMDFEGWFNVMDPTFNLHVREAAIVQSWLVRKPTVDGIVSSLEIFDNEGQLLCTLFGKRKPGIKEDATWRRMLDALEDTHPFLGG